MNNEKCESLGSISLGNTYKDYFLIGAAVNMGTIKTHKDLIIKHFSSLTAENDMKFARVHPQEKVYTFDAADSIMEFAESNHLKMRGHTLVWHNQTSDRVFQDQEGKSVSRNVLLSRMKEHIETVAGRYKGKIYAWDVVNEAIEDKRDDFYRKTKWFEIIGEDYLDKAFEYAHGADPDAALFYNDYNAVYPGKRDKIYTLVKGMKERGIPVHGIGIQGHWSIYGPSVEDIKAALDLYASLGMQIHITELDLSVYRWDQKDSDLKEPTQEMLDMQEKKYDEIFGVFREYKDVITSVTFWGVADDKTWLDNFPVRNRKNWPFVFDVNHCPKKSFERIVRF